MGVFEDFLELFRKPRQVPARYRIGTVVSIEPLLLSVDGLPVRAEMLIRLRGITELAKEIPLEGFEIKAGDRVALLPDDEDSCYIMLGVIA